MKLKALALLILASVAFLSGCATDSTVDTTDLSAVGHQDIQSQNQAKLEHATTF